MTTKIWRTIIIDDEELARQRLKRLLSVYDHLNIIAEAANGAEGLQQIEKHQPDLIFLDVEMPVLNGFEMLSQLKKQPKVIFTTAYDQYAVKAFEEESIDYLLKPVEAERLEKSMQKLQKHQGVTAIQIPFELLADKFNIKKEIKTLTVKIGDRILLIKLADITFIEAEDKYVFLNTADGKRHLTDFTITALQEKLPDTFLRVSRSTIINSDAIKEIRKSFNGTLVFLLTDTAGSKCSSSRGYTQALK
ncbi:DNA-binding response regulator, partial [Pedobacter sp. HMWF019]|uniref:LytR/AlgR family response regulator transcription factor n=1 Tax=Pedobacter sp. HMWF019 TaxID=2056856 RepID=UPI000D371768